MSTKYQRLATAHTLSLPAHLRNNRNPWRAMSIATRLIPVEHMPSFGAFASLFTDGVRPAFIPVYHKQPRRSHIQRPAGTFTQ